MPVDAFVLMVVGGLFGTVAGSFAATLAIRWERQQSVVRGRSSCDACDTPLAPIELLPLVGFVLAHGRCRHCGVAIDVRHPVIEIACGLAGSIALARHPDSAGWAGALFGWLLIVLGAIDAACFWLPDRLTGTLALTGLAAGVVRVGSPPLTIRVLGLIVGFSALEMLRFAYRKVRGREGLGGGDAKLFAGIGAWLGWEPLPYVALGAAVGGFVWVGMHWFSGRAVSRRDRLPLGTLLAGRAWLLWLNA